MVKRATASGKMLSTFTPTSMTNGSRYSYKTISIITLKQFVTLKFIQKRGFLKMRLSFKPLFLCFSFIVCKSWIDSDSETDNLVGIFVLLRDEILCFSCSSDYIEGLLWLDFWTNLLTNYLFINNFDQFYKPIFLSTFFD